VGRATIDIQILREPLSSPAARPLLAAFEREVAALYPQWTPAVGPSARPDELEPPTGGFFVAYADAEAVACGGFKRLTDRIAEVKRMYTARDMRGRGLGAMILARVESEAAAAGYELIRLDTGVHQPHAIALYRSAGYYEIPDYNGNPPASYWFEKLLRGQGETQTT
jgi:GNAT superfamily N-acetyltransferase